VVFREKENNNHKNSMGSRVVARREKKLRVLASKA